MSTQVFDCTPGPLASQSKVISTQRVSPATWDIRTVIRRFFVTLDGDDDPSFTVRTEGTRMACLLIDVHDPVCLLF